MIPLINQDINQILILVITPAFFLTGIAGILSILSHRISRAVDRLNLIRTFEIDNKKTSKIEKKTLLLRITIIHWSLLLAIICALSICIIVFLLLMNSIISYKFNYIIFILFSISMITIITSLSLLILEIIIYIRNASLYRL
ncbi:DUF2721 domain-containing protein [Aeromonas salmonicida]|uniref:DUF2721 domain-containing protein n=1 Tax=Aeromonas salmonicida TaxID=645 RepID=UPI001CEC0D11